MFEMIIKMSLVTGLMCLMNVLIRKIAGNNTKKPLAQVIIGVLFALRLPRRSPCRPQRRSPLLPLRSGLSGSFHSITYPVHQFVHQKQWDLISRRQIPHFAQTLLSPKSMACALLQPNRILPNASEIRAGLSGPLPGTGTVIFRPPT